MIVWIVVPPLLHSVIAGLLGLVAGIAFIGGRLAGQSLVDRLLGVRP